MDVQEGNSCTNCGGDRPTLPCQSVVPITDGLLCLSEQLCLECFSSRRSHAICETAMVSTGDKKMAFVY